MAGLCRGGVLAATALALLAVPGQVWALGEEVNGFPRWEERVMHTFANRARVDPQAELATCGANCGEAACYTVQPPLQYSLPHNRAARFHGGEMTHQSYFAHDSACTVVDNIDGLFPQSCDGEAACACAGGVPACNPTCTPWFTRIQRFTSSATGEIIASGAPDPEQSFYLWLHEPSPDPTCAFSTSNGHRWLLLKQTGGIGFGLHGVNTVGDFGQVASATAKIPSGSHYPRQGGQARAVEVWANWFDPAAPSSAQVNLDGACTPLALGRGTGSSGAWTAKLAQLDAGCHRYYFQFKDANNQSFTYPDTGSLGIGPASCADWNATRAPLCTASALPVPATGHTTSLLGGLVLLLVALALARGARPRQS